jgi:hypothetical protein
MDWRERDRMDGVRMAKSRLTLSYISPMLQQEMGSAAPLGEQIGCSSQGILVWKILGNRILIMCSMEVVCMVWVRNRIESMDSYIPVLEGRSINSLQVCE